MNITACVAPRPLLPGGTIGLFAPSGVINVERHEKSVAYLQAMGFKIVVAADAAARYRYFAGTDEQRLASFHQMLADPSIDAMMMIRGGYGWSRLLHRIDWTLVAATRKTLVGFSDFTAFNLAALANCRLITFAGPGAAIDFGGADDANDVQHDHAFMEAHCWPVLRGDPLHAGSFACAHPYPAQILEGPLWGSNLSLLAHLVGTPYLPAISDGILFVEEIGEQPYAIERMFWQLYHAGILQTQRAIVLADFTDCDPETGGNQYSMEHVVDTLRTILPIPVLTGLPFGHVAKKLTLPYGAPAYLSIEPTGFSLDLNPR